MSSPTATATTLQLPLDPDGLHPRRLVDIDGTIIAFGGDDGTIVKVHVVVDDDGNNNNVATPTITVVRRWDEEAVRIVACRADGKRIAVGFDTGTVLVYVYDDYVMGSNNDHPFCRVRHELTTDNNDHDDDVNLLLSQSEHVQGQYSHETVWAGPSFDTTIRDLVFHPTHTHLLGIGTEGGMCVIDTLSSDLLHQKHFASAWAKAHDGSGIRALSFGRMMAAADHILLSSLGMDGRACVWEATTATPDTWTLRQRDDCKCVIKPDVGEMLGSDAWDRSSHMSFGNKKHWLALPGEPYLQLRTIKKATADDLTITNDDQVPSSHHDDDDNKNNTEMMAGHLESIVCMASENDYLISSSRDGRVVLWDMAAATTPVLLKHLGEYCAAPTYIHIKKQDVWIIGADAKLVILRDALPKRRQARAATTSTTIGATKTAALETTVRPLDDSDDDDDSVEGQKQSVNNPFIDDEAKDDISADDDDDTSAIPKRAKAATATRAAPSPDADLDDDDDLDDFDLVRDFPPVPRHCSMAAPTELSPPQPAFAPSATPLDLARRFLCWNHLGSVTSLANDQDGRSSVDIDFSNSAFRRPLSFTDNMGFVLGTLGEDGGFFATDLQDEADDEEDDALRGLHMSEATKKLVKRSHQSRMKTGGQPSGSTLYFHRFETFASARDKDWYLTLPDGERVLGCAAGEGWAAAMTSRRFLRLYTSGGNQGRVLWLNGEPVTATGRGRFLAAFYHDSMPLPDGTQKLGYLLYDVTKDCLVATDAVTCISSGSMLAWVGFSNDGSLLVMDSDGMLSMLVCTSTGDGWMWMPMLDTIGLRKSAEDSFWPITISDGKLVCVPLKGGIQHPDAARRPVTTTLGFRIPLARGTLTASNAMEELSIRADIALQQKQAFQRISVEGEDDEDFEREFLTLSAQDKVTLKFFAATVEAGKLERALDLVDRLHLEKSFNLAMSLADSHRKLADLIEDARDRKFEGEGGDEDEDADYSASPVESGAHSLSRITPEGSTAGKRAFDDLENNARQDRRKNPFVKISNG